MRGLLLLFQLAAGVGRVTPADSSALLERLKDEQFWFIMRWRYQVEFDRMPTPPPHFDVLPSRAIIYHTMREPGVPLPALLPKRLNLKYPTGERGCDHENNIHVDMDQHSWLAHLIKNPDKIVYSACPRLVRGEPLVVTPGWIDANLSPKARDSSRALRARMLSRLDSAAARLPHDRWIVGQRVRLYLDHANVARARVAAAECRAEAWWCLAIQAYVAHMSGQPAAALADRAHAAMPLADRCEWDDIGPLVQFSGRQSYEARSCAERDSLNRVAWWLADPLFLEPGNERYAAQLIRRMEIELHRAAEVDLFTDWRPNYQGPMLTEMLARYGTPYLTMGVPSFKMSAFGLTPDPRRPLDYVKPQSAPVGWKFGRFDSRSVFLGHGFGASYPGTPTHTLPAWRAIVDPLSVSDDDWDLAPRRDTLTYWDGSWWATEFFMRPAGPIVPLEYQVARFRRFAGPQLAAAVRWDTAGFTFQSPEVPVFAALFARPGEAVRGKVDSPAARPTRPVVTDIAPGASIVSLELVDRRGVGAAGRARFGLTAPEPLSSLRPGEIAVSDLALARATAGEGPPATFDAMLARMLGTTTLRRPTSVAVYWEVYGLGERDTVDYALRIVRDNDANVAERVLSLVGVGNTGTDSVVVVWREPRAGDPSATVDNGISVRPRSVVLDVSGLAAGRYRLDVTIQRHGASAVSTQRRFVILRD